MSLVTVVQLDHGQETKIAKETERPHAESEGRAHEGSLARDPEETVPRTQQ